MSRNNTASRCYCDVYVSFALLYIFVLQKLYMLHMKNTLISFEDKQIFNLEKQIANYI